MPNNIKALTRKKEANEFELKRICVVFTEKSARMFFFQSCVSIFLFTARLLYVCQGQGKTRRVLVFFSSHLYFSVFFLIL